LCDSSGLIIIYMQKIVDLAKRWSGPSAGTSAADAPAQQQTQPSASNHVGPGTADASVKANNNEAKAVPSREHGANGSQADTEAAALTGPEATVSDWEHAQLENGKTEAGTAATGTDIKSVCFSLAAQEIQVCGMP
jgi:hypothetical protein